MANYCRLHQPQSGSRLHHWVSCLVGRDRVVGAASVSLVCHVAFRHLAAWIPPGHDSSLSLDRRRRRPPQHGCAGCVKNVSEKPSAPSMIIIIPPRHGPGRCRNLISSIALPTIHMKEMGNIVVCPSWHPSPQFCHSVSTPMAELCPGQGTFSRCGSACKPRSAILRCWPPHPRSFIWPRCRRWTRG